MSGKLPIIDQLQNAEDNRARARILLQCPDAVLLYADGRQMLQELRAACRRAGFAAGEQYIALRWTALHQVRGPDGLHKDGIFAQARASFARFVSGETG